MFKELSERRIEIFLELLRSGKGLKISEIAKRIGMNQPKVTRNIEILEKANFVVSTYVKGKRGVAKVCYPTFRGFFEPIAKEKKIKLTDEDIKAIDNFFLHPKIKKIILFSGLIGVKKRKKGYTLEKLFEKAPLRVRLFFALTYGIEKAFDEVKNDKELQKLTRNFEKVLKKFL